MKWFKHISDSLRDPFIYGGIQKHGGDFYLVFFGTLELYAREFRPVKRFKMDVHKELLRSHLVSLPCTKIAEILQYIDGAGKWSVTNSGDNVVISIPKFYDLLDETTLKKLRKIDGTRSGTAPEQNPAIDVDVDVDVDVDRDRDKEKNKKKEKRSPSRFKPPTPKEVSEYALTLEPPYTIDGEAFCAYYASKGWKVGNSTMKSWEHAVVTWKNRDKAKAKEGHQAKTLTLSDAKAELRHDSFYYESEVESRCSKLSVGDAEMLRQWARERWPEKEREECTDEDREAAKAELSKFIDEIGGKA